jgi:predicted ABC-class ATPase
MQTKQDLKKTLERIDGRGYKAYKDLRGSYDFGDFALFIDHVQGDPFAAPSRLHVEVPQKIAAFPEWSRSSKSRRVALCDYVTRAFAEAARRVAKGHRGSGKGGRIEIDRPGQEVMERSSALLTDGRLEVRFFAGLPAFGRKIAGREADTMLTKELPDIVREALLFESLDTDGIVRHVETIEDADSLRGQLAERGAIAFVPDGCILPRRSGVDQRPMPRNDAVPFESPPELRATVTLPNGGNVSGMELRRGVNLIVGGGYHGKSTLLQALERGVYNHVPDDGRELVVADPAAYKIRAEDGRSVERSCITPFISNLPHGATTDAFSSEDASGSTSQAANIVEALEAGAQVLLIDEDTSATNFMIRDHRMQELVARDHEPITPFIDKVRQLYDELGISTVLVLGGSGDYFDVADEVIAMHEYRPEHVTERAREIAERYKTERRAEGGERFGNRIDRAPTPESVDPSKGKHDAKTKPRGVTAVDFGTEHIDLQAVEQLVHSSQTRAIAQALVRARKLMDGQRTIAELLRYIELELDEQGLDALSSKGEADFARFRPLELAAALNRLRSLKVNQVE